jgi:hypothetical protein
VGNSPKKSTDIILTKVLAITVVKSRRLGWMGFVRSVNEKWKLEFSRKNLKRKEHLGKLNVDGV